MCRPRLVISMATKKTAIFTLTERVNVSASGTTAFATIDLGSYVDVGDRQALQVHSVDFIYQGNDPDEVLQATFTSDTQINCQVTDLNRSQLVFADDRALVASAQLNFDQNANNLSMEADMFPDNFGKGSDDGRFVVNDALYIAGRCSGSLASSLNITVRVNASIVTLSAKDFMAIAIQSTAADN